MSMRMVGGITLASPDHGLFSDTGQLRPVEEELARLTLYERHRIKRALEGTEDVPDHLRGVWEALRREISSGKR